MRAVGAIDLSLKVVSRGRPIAQLDARDPDEEARRWEGGIELREDLEAAAQPGVDAPAPKLNRGLSPGVAQLFFGQAVQISCVELAPEDRAEEARERTHEFRSR